MRNEHEQRHGAGGVGRGIIRLLPPPLYRSFNPFYLVDDI